MSYIGAQPTTAAFVTDQFSGDGSTTVFTMSVAPANSASVIVAVSGVLQDPSTYAVSGTSLTFSGAPPAGSGNISARYLGIPASGVASTAYRTLTEFTATSGQTTFSVPSYTAGFINVYRNGVMLGTADFTATSGTTVVLAAGATAGDLVATESFYVSGVSNAIPAVAGAVNTSYITDGAVTTAKIDDAAVTDAKLGPYIPQKGVPAFRAYLSANQTVTNGVDTLVTLNIKAFDTASRFNNTGATVDGIPAYAFMPNVAGYYQFNVTAGASATSSLSYNYSQVRKNGVADTVAIYGPYLGTANYGALSTLTYLNGTTDYIQLYVVIGGTGTLTVVGNSPSLGTYMSGVLVRAD